MKIQLLFFLLIIPLITFGQAPVLFFSDLDHGHRTGNNDVSMGQKAGVNGDFITIWGKNLGNLQSTSIVSVNGSTADKIYFWGPANSANFAADLYSSHGMQAVIFQVPSSAKAGNGTISISVGGQQSNTLPFAVMTGGKTLFISGSDGNNNYNGLYPKYKGGINGPWHDHSMLTTKDKFNIGDVVYIRSGIYDTLSRPDWGALLVTYPADSGTTDLPKAVVAYPNEIPLMCHDTIIQKKRV